MYLAHVPFSPAVMLSRQLLRAVLASTVFITGVLSAASPAPPAPSVVTTTITTTHTSSTAVAPTSPAVTPSSTLVAPSLSTPATTIGNTATTVASSAAAASSPPDVYLNVPNLSVGRIELDVDNLQADINLNANVASLVTINAGVALSVQNINLTIVDVQAELELIVRLGHLVDIVNRVFQSLDLNPLLISTLNNVTSVLQPIVGAIDGLLGTVTQSGTTLSLLVDNLGNIVQQVIGANGSPVSTIVGNYLTNMTATGAVEQLAGGLTQTTYSYAPLNALVDVVTNTAGQVVQASVVKQTSTATSTAPKATATA